MTDKNGRTYSETYKYANYSGQWPYKLALNLGDYYKVMRVNTMWFNLENDLQMSRTSISKLCVFTCLLRCVFDVVDVMAEMKTNHIHFAQKHEKTFFGSNKCIFYALSLSFLFSVFLRRLGILCSNLIQMRVNLSNLMCLLARILWSYFRITLTEFTVSWLKNRNTPIKCWICFRLHLHFSCFFSQYFITSLFTITLSIFHCSFSTCN